MTSRIFKVKQVSSGRHLYAKIRVSLSDELIHQYREEVKQNSDPIIAILNNDDGLQPVKRDLPDFAVTFDIFENCQKGTDHVEEDHYTRYGCDFRASETAKCMPSIRGQMESRNIDCATLNIWVLGILVFNWYDESDYGQELHTRGDKLFWTIKYRHYGMNKTIMEMPLVQRTHANIEYFLEDLGTQRRFGSLNSKSSGEVREMVESQKQILQTQIKEVKKYKAIVLSCLNAENELIRTIEELKQQNISLTEECNRLRVAKYTERTFQPTTPANEDLKQDKVLGRLEPENLKDIPAWKRDEINDKKQLLEAFGIKEESSSDDWDIGSPLKRTFSKTSNEDQQLNKGTLESGENKRLKGNSSLGTPTNLPSSNPETVIRDTKAIKDVESSGSKDHIFSQDTFIDDLGIDTDTDSVSMDNSNLSKRKDAANIKNPDTNSLKSPEKAVTNSSPTSKNEDDSHSSGEETQVTEGELNEDNLTEVSDSSSSNTEM